MDKRLFKSRTVSHLERGAGRGKKQFRPNINGAAAEEKLATTTATLSPLTEAKQEPASAKTASKKPKMTRPPRGFDRVSSIFEVGAGHSEPRTHNAPSLSYLGLVKEGGGNSAGGIRVGAPVGAQENLDDSGGNFQVGYDRVDVAATQNLECRGTFDPITPFHDGRVKPVENVYNHCSNLLFNSDETQKPILFQLPLGVFEPPSNSSGPIKLGRIQKMKSGKLRLLIPTAVNQEQEVPVDRITSVSEKSNFNAVELSFSSSSQSSVAPLSQVVCVFSSQTAVPPHKVEPLSPVVGVQPSTTSLQSQMYVLGPLGARISSSVNF